MGHATYLSSKDNWLAQTDVTVTVAASSADANYPVANVNVLPVAKPFRFTGKTSENLQIDLGAARVVNLVAILNHNLTSGATVTVNGGSSANPNGGQYTTTISWREFDAFKLITTQTWRYWKLIFADTGNTDAFIQVGYVLIGNASDLTFGFNYGWSLEDECSSLELESEYGTAHVASLYYRVLVRLDFDSLTLTEMTVLRNLYLALGRNMRPFFFIPDKVVGDGYFVRWASYFSQVVSLRRSVSVELKEESRGKKMVA
jgi:hypothetical protein